MHRESPSVISVENKEIEFMAQEVRDTILLIIARSWDSPESELSLYPTLFRRLADKTGKPLHIRVHNITEDPNIKLEVGDRAVIIGGSPHCLDENLPWMNTLKDFIRKVAETKVKMLGICFGHQIIAEAFGGKVEKCSVGGELGKISIDLTDLGKGDDMFKNLSTTFTTRAAHRDVVVEPPEGAQILAQNNSNEYQAFSIGPNIKTIQFHPEMTSDYFQTLIQNNKEALKEAGIIRDEDHFNEMLADASKKESSSMSMRVLINFLEQL